MTYDSASLSCQCLDVTSGSSTSTCTCEQQTVNGENRIIFRNAFSSGLAASSNVRITLGGLVNPETATATNSFKIYTHTGKTKIDIMIHSKLIDIKIFALVWFSWLS